MRCITYPQIRSYSTDDVTNFRPKYGVFDIADAKTAAVVINVHAHKDSGLSQLEMPRLVLYLSNKLFVVSERGLDAELEAQLEGGVVFIPPWEKKVGVSLCVFTAV